MIEASFDLRNGRMNVGRKSSAPSAVDPLGDLVSQRTKAAASAGAPKPTDLAPHDVTFPGILSDGNRPTTALAAVRNAPTAASASSP